METKDIVFKQFVLGEKAVKSLIVLTYYYH